MSKTPQRSIRLTDKDWELLKEKGGSKFIHKILNEEEAKIEKMKKLVNSSIWAIKNVDNPDLDRVVDILECVLDI